MQHLKYKGETYSCCAPRPIGNSRYTCDAWKRKNGREVKNHETLHALGNMLIKGASASDKGKTSRVLLDPSKHS